MVYSPWGRKESDTTERLRLKNKQKAQSELGYQSILKESSPGWSLEGLMLKLKLQYFGHLMWRADSLEKTLMLEKIEGRRRRGRQRMRWLDGITDSMTWVWVNFGSRWWTGRPGVLWFMGSQSQTRLSNWTELNWAEGGALTRCDTCICNRRRKDSSFPGIDSAHEQPRLFIASALLTSPLYKVPSFACPAETCTWFPVFADAELPFSADPK